MHDMVLKKIIIRNFGSIDTFSHEFGIGLNILKLGFCDEHIYGIRTVLCHKALPPCPPSWVRADTEIEASVCVNKKIYLLTVSPDADCRRLILKAYDSIGKEVIDEYLYLCSHCPEQDLSDIFEGDENKMFLKFLQYANEDMYYAPKELAKMTDGVSEIRAFRAYLRDFIRNFKSEAIRPGRQYEIILKKNGVYDVKRNDDSDFPPKLSQSEETLFKYLCFLRTAEFWRGFEELRNLNGIKKPLLVKDFLYRLDDSIDINKLLHRADNLNRQVIILS